VKPYFHGELNIGIRLEAKRKGSGLNFLFIYHQFPPFTLMPVTRVVYLLKLGFVLTIVRVLAPVRINAISTKCILHSVTGRQYNKIDHIKHLKHMS